MSLDDPNYSRHIPFEGTPNFRDYGGYRTEKGARVKWRSLFRSGQLARLTAADLDHLQSLDIRLVFDFRREEERYIDPSQFPQGASPVVVDLPISPGSSFNFLERVATGQLQAADMVDFMCEINRDLAYNQVAHYRCMFERLLGQSGGASLIHCSAGKDRTGFAAALILSALGVSREQVMQDYMLTAIYFDVDREIARICKKYHWQGEAGSMRPMLEVREQYLAAAFEAIDAKFADLNAYLTEELKVDHSARETLRHRYLEF